MAESVMTVAYDSGVNLFDTAEVYASGRYSMSCQSVRLTFSTCVSICPLWCTFWVCHRSDIFFFTALKQTFSKTKTKTSSGGAGELKGGKALAGGEFGWKICVPLRIISESNIHRHVTHVDDIQCDWHFLMTSSATNIHKSSQKSERRGSRTSWESLKFPSVSK